MEPALRVAFASNDRTHVNQHFGSAEGLFIYDVSSTRAQLVAVGEFPPTAMDGNEDKLAAKIDFLAGCAAVFVMAIGASAIRQLMAHGVQPMRIEGGNRIEDILAEVRAGLRDGGVGWIDKALNRRADPQRLHRMLTEAWAE